MLFGGHATLPQPKARAAGPGRDSPAAANCPHGA